MTFIWACRNVKIACSRAPVGSSLQKQSSHARFAYSPGMHKYIARTRRRAIHLTKREHFHLGKRAPSTITSKLHVSAFPIQVRRTGRRLREFSKYAASAVFPFDVSFYKRTIKCATTYATENVRASYSRDIVCVESLYCHVNELKISQRAIKNNSQVVNWVKTNFIIITLFYYCARRVLSVERRNFVPRLLITAAAIKCPRAGININLRAGCLSCLEIFFFSRRPTDDNLMHTHASASLANSCQ